MIVNIILLDKIKIDIMIPYMVLLIMSKTKIILDRILKRRMPDYKPIEKKGLFCNVNKWIGSKDKYGKKDFLKYQKDLWTTVNYHRTKIQKEN